jgi:hypothetical protein
MKKISSFFSKLNEINDYQSFEDELSIGELNKKYKKIWKGYMQCYVYMTKLYKNRNFGKAKEEIYWIVIGKQRNLYLFKKPDDLSPTKKFNLEDLEYVSKLNQTDIEMVNINNKKNYLIRFFNINDKKKFDIAYKNLVLSIN